MIDGEAIWSAKALLEAAAQIIAGAGDREAKLLAICKLIQERVPHCDWVGWYLIDPCQRDELVLGPFVGAATEHVRIPVGRGICGQAAAREETIVVADVAKEANYLSCSAEVRSEIVVPLIKEGRIVGELDIDSHRLAAFGGAEKELFGRLCAIVAGIF